MGVSTPILQITRGKVGSDLTAKQWFLVKLSGATVALCAAITDLPLGVLANKPNTGTEPPTINIVGISKVHYGGTVAVGDKLGPDADGKAIKIAEGAGTKDGYLGLALVAGADDDIGTVLLTGPGLVTTET